MEYVLLKEICNINMGQSPASSTYNDTKVGLPFYQGNADFGDLYPKPRIWCDKPIKIAKRGDILISVRAPIGALNYAKEECCIGRGIASITIDDNNFSREFIYWCLKNKTQQLQNMGTGSTFKAINKKNLEEIKIPKIELDIQLEIVNNLQKANQIIKDYNTEYELLDELVKARFSEVFGNRDEIKYEMVALKEICTTITGGTPSTRISEYYNGNIPWISTVSLGPNHIDGTTAKAYITQKAIENSSTKLIPPNNILFGTRVGVGKSSINDVEMCTNQDIVAIMGVDERLFNKLYIKHVLDSYQPYFDSIKKGATILGITADDLKKVLIPRAPLELQNQFADFVHEVDKSRLTIQKSLESTQELFDSLMQKYFG